MADFFIKRPILSICLSVIIVLLGAFSILRLPISEYPDIIPPSIQVTATYPGADCETVVKSIASPIEQQMSGVDGMSYMTSVNTNNGQMSMMILLKSARKPTWTRCFPTCATGRPPPSCRRKSARWESPSARQAGCPPWSSASIPPGDL